MTNLRTVFNLRDFGAHGDGAHSDTLVLQDLIDEAARTFLTGGTELSVRVHVPAGIYLIAPVELRSGVELYLEAEATLLASRDIRDYRVIEARWEGSTRQTYAPLIYARSADNISLTGQGTIDGRGDEWWRLFREKSLSYPRPRLIGFSDCGRVLLQGLRLLNSPSWTVNPVRCRDVTIRGLSIFNPPDSPNTDGINPDSCQKVLIEDCHVSVGDDCITLKSGTELETPELRAPSTDIRVRNCVLERGHGAIVIGSEMSGGVSNVRVEHCRFVGTDRGIRMKSRRGRGGMVDNIHISDIDMRNVLSPFTMNLYYGCGAWGDPLVGDKGPRPVNQGTPVFRNITIKNVKATDVRYAAAFIYGLPESPIQNLSIENYRADMAPRPATPSAGTELGGRLGTELTQISTQTTIAPSIAADREPDPDSGYPEMADGLPIMSREGFFARNVDGLRLRSIEIRNQTGPAFLVRDCLNIDSDIEPAVISPPDQQ